MNKQLQKMASVNGEWVAASSTYNYMLKDPLLDWLGCHYKTLANTHEEYKPVVKKCIKAQKSEYNFTTYIMEQGNQFEAKIIDYLRNKFTSSRIIDIHGETGPRDQNKVKETLEAMKLGVPFIHSGVLHNDENRTFGIPDLLVRSDWLKFLVNDSPLTTKEEKIGAPLLGKQKWHYRVIDIKFTSLLLRADGKHLLNANSFPAYKVQLFIYNEALSKLQGYNPPQTYILGRRWKCITHGTTYMNNSCFDKLGIIDYINIDRDYVQYSQEAIQWVREVTHSNAAKWNITNYPLDRWELYPNMCNKHDGHWHEVKQHLAQTGQELTSLWMVGPSNRDLALERGVTKWSDKKCNASLLGINGEKQSFILDTIIKINKSSRHKILPEIVSNNIGLWKQIDPIEFFVDFETTNSAMSHINTVSKTQNQTTIFMIGVGYLDPSTKLWTYHDFTVNSISPQEEHRICHEFARFIYNKSKEYGMRSPRCIHWSNAEYNLWLDAVDRYDDLLDYSIAADINWLDLLLVFKEEPIVIKGCMSFGLKDVAVAMKNHGFIETSWDKNSVCVDGLSAMVAAYHAHIKACEKGISMRQLKIVKDIIKYNEVDVRVLAEILVYLRSNHIIKSTALGKRQSTSSTTSNKRSRSQK